MNENKLTNSKWGGHFNLKAFTLIELLAVIVILAVISLIATPFVTNAINSAKKGAFKDSLYSVFRASDYYLALNDFTPFPEEGINILDERLEIKNNHFVSGKIIKNKEGNLELENVSTEEYCGNGTLTNLTITKGNCDSNDNTAPIVNSLIFNKITATSLGLSVDYIEKESHVKNISFSIDGINWVESKVGNSPSTTYTFNDLNPNTEYTVKVKITNTNNLTSNEVSVTGKTLNFELPSITYEDRKSVV